MSEEKGTGLGMPLEFARQSLRDDPQTPEIAEALGVEVEEYIDRVLHYALHPNEEPELEVLDDESVAALGPDAPSMRDVTKWFEGVASGEISLEDRVVVAEKDGFTTEAAPSEALRASTGQAISRNAPRIGQPAKGNDPSSGPGSVLKQQMLEQQRNFQLGMDARRAGRGGKKEPS